MTEIDMRRLTIGQPGLDPVAPARGVVIGLVLGGLLWVPICGLACLAWDWL